MGTGGEGVLKQAGILVISSLTCNSPDWYGNDFDASTMICAGYPEGGHDACQVRQCTSQSKIIV